ncbi:MAG: ATP-binding protein [Chloroflexi bacterium]|nr:ATP-binding protein [Chloroflexota bacterium]
MTLDLDQRLRHLRLSGMAAALPVRNQEAIHHHLAYTDFLELLVEDELVTRRDRLFARRLKQAGIPEVKTLEAFDWSFNPQAPKALILDLATGRFVREHGGLLLLGPPGTGKSHIAVALTVAAIQSGYTALYRSAFDLAQDLAETQATGTRKELVAELCKVDLLVLEDLGMRRLPPTAAEDLLEVFVRRYEKGAIILTTNRPLEDWGQVLGDTAAAGAILDRFLHHAEVVRLQGRSYRMQNRKELHAKGQNVVAPLTSEAK